MIKRLIVVPVLLLSLSLWAQDSASRAQAQAEAHRQNELVRAFNDASKTFNRSVDLFNVFINYRNDKFKPEKPDAEIEQMLDSADHQLQAAKKQAYAITPTSVDGDVQRSLQQLKDAIAQAEPHVRECQQWLTKYLFKSRLGRKTMFYKFSWSS
jgi:hypothetical protein